MAEIIAKLSVWAVLKRGYHDVYHTYTQGKMASLVIGTEGKRVRYRELVALI